MKERIKELYEQAHIERQQEYFSSVVDPTIKSVSVTRHFDLDLFAELIVRECASAVNSRDDSDTGFWANIIKEHFGVKE